MSCSRSYRFALPVLAVCLGLGLGASCSEKTAGVAPDAGAAATPDAGGSSTPTGCQVAPCTLSSPRARELFAALLPEVNDLVDGNTTFALALYKTLREDAESVGHNLFFSPYSISSALAMTFAGARGATASEMATVLSFGLPQEQLHRAFNALDQEWARRAAKPVTEAGGEPFRLTVANGLWGAHKFEFVPAYLDLLAVNYGASLQLLDFAGDPAGARATINKWVEDKTAGRIKDLVRPPSPTTDTRLALTNAIYFRASWSSSFAPNDTSDRPFHLIDGRTVTVPTLEQDHRFPYFDSGMLQAVTLPFVGEELTMTIVVPKAGALDAVEAALTPAALQDIIDRQAITAVLLRLPKFKFGARFQLVPTLKKIGILAAFVEAADFSGISEEKLRISEVVHQAFVGVDEKGVEAAAATAVFAPPPPVGGADITLDIDRPFLFFIRDRPTGAILFAGRLLDPTQP